MGVNIEEKTKSFNKSIGLLSEGKLDEAYIYFSNAIFGYESNWDWVEKYSNEIIRICTNEESDFRLSIIDNLHRFLNSIMVHLNHKDIDKWIILINKVNNMYRDIEEEDDDLYEDEDENKQEDVVNDLLKIPFVEDVKKSEKEINDMYKVLEDFDLDSFDNEKKTKLNDWLQLRELFIRINGQFVSAKNLIEIIEKNYTEGEDIEDFSGFIKESGNNNEEDSENHTNIIEFVTNYYYYNNIVINNLLSLKKMLDDLEVLEFQCENKYCIFSKIKELKGFYEEKAWEVDSWIIYTIRGFVDAVIGPEGGFSWKLIIDELSRASSALNELKLLDRMNINLVREDSISIQKMIQIAMESQRYLYSSWALGLLDVAYEESREWFTDNIDRKIMIEKYLGEIDTRYLTYEVSKAYDEVFNFIYSKLKPEYRLDVSRSLLESEKRDINTF